MRNKHIRTAARAIHTANTVSSRSSTNENMFPGVTAGLAKLSEYLGKLPKLERNI